MLFMENIFFVSSAGFRNKNGILQGIKTNKK